MEPHSSASMWPNVIQRSRSTGSTPAASSDTSGNIARGPVWNRRGWSAWMRNWLNVNPAGGAMSATQVDRAISSTLVIRRAPCG
jgi:hypothetical protein